MSTTFEPRVPRTVLAVSIAAMFATVQPLAFAEDDEVAALIRPDSVVEVGVGYVSESSAKFGEFTGLDEKGGFFIGGFDVNKRYGDDATFYRMTGRNLGLDSRSLGFQGGQQGNYEFRMDYDETPKLWSDSYQTPFVNPGSTSLTLPAGFVRGTSTSGMTTLNASMHPFDVATKRKALGVGFGKQLPAGWDVDVRVRRENKDGNRFIGAVIGNSGGNPRAAIVPEPVDYTTDELEALARYTGEKYQLQFGYLGSFFRNANSALAWQNPFASSVWVSTATPGVTTYNNGQLALPPDNQFHQLSASGGYTISKDTRVSGSLSYGRGTQDDAFLPYTINPALAATITSPLPRNSLDGRVDNTHADVKLSTKLMPKLHLTAGYRFDDRDNKTAQALYRYIGGDSQGQAAAGLGKARINLPTSSQRHVFDTDLDYHMTASTKLKFGYEYEYAKKTFEAIENEKEHTVKAEVHQHFNEMVSGGLGYAYSDRSTSEYNASAPYLATFTSAYTSGQALQWDNVPTQRKFFLAPRIRDKVRGFINVSPTEAVDLEFGFDYKDDDYHKSIHGLKRAKGYSLNFDMNVVATDALSGHVFTSWDEYKTSQLSVALGAVQANFSNPGFNWGADIRDRTLTAGAGLRYKPIGKYEFGADVMHARTKGETGVFTGPSIAATQQATPLPNLETRLSRLDLFGQYKLQKDVSLKLKYIFEHYTSTDWAYDQVTANTMANVIGTNQVSPRYNVHVIGVSVAYQF